VVVKAVAKKAKAKAAKPRWLCVRSNPKHGPSVGSEELGDDSGEEGEDGEEEEEGEEGEEGDEGEEGEEGEEGDN